LWKAMQKIGGPVEGVDDPLEFRLAGYTAFLREYRMSRVGVEQHLDNRLLGLAVDFGYEIVDRFLRHR